jgi:hypothetical protein
MPPAPQPSIKDLVTKTATDAQRLVKAQAALLQAEVSATGGKIGKGAGLGIATAFIAVFIVLFLLLTIAFVLVALGLPIWAGMLIVTVLLIIGATVTGLLAKKSFEEIKAPAVAMEEFEKTKAMFAGGSTDADDVPAVPAVPTPPTAPDAPTS